MHWKILLCFAVIFCIFPEVECRRRKTYLRLLYGGKRFLQSAHNSVVNGKLDKNKMIEVVIENSDGLCGGTIIGDRFILTAAHCFVPEAQCHETDESKIKSSIPAISKIEVYIEGICHHYKGKDCPEADAGKLIQAKSLHILSEYYQKSCTSGDLAIIELAEVIGDHGATLPDNTELPTSGDYQVSGFGEDPENSDNTGHNLKTVTLTLQKCNGAFHDSICTVEIDKDACHGDSGGALVDKKNDVILGVVSGGEECQNMYTSVLNAQSDELPLKQWKGGLFTSTAMHYGFICEIAGAIKGCPQTFEKETYLTLP